MLKAWRRTAVAALAGGAAIAAQLMVIAPAQAAAPTITIFATSKLKVVTNDVFVVYQASNGFGSANIHGKITGAAVGDVAALYAQQFPYKTKPAPIASKTLTAGTQVYSFKVTPNLATRYALRLFPSSTSQALIATSKAQNLYVSPRGSFTPGQNCPRPLCHISLKIHEVLPSSALSTEMGKHVYPYFGVNLSPTKIPPAPKVLTLNAAHPVVSKLRKVNATEFTFSISWTFTIGNDAARWLPAECQKDSEGKDGLGLPGSHGCGAHQISATSFYIG